MNYINVGRHIQSSHGSYEICFSLLDLYAVPVSGPSKVKKVANKAGPFPVTIASLDLANQLLDGYVMFLVQGSLNYPF